MEQDPELERIRTNAARREAELTAELSRTVERADREAIDRALDELLAARPDVGSPGIVKGNLRPHCRRRADGVVCAVAADGREVTTDALLDAFLRDNPVLAGHPTPAAQPSRSAPAFGTMPADELRAAADRELSAPSATPPGRRGPSPGKLAGDALLEAAARELAGAEPSRVKHNKALADMTPDELKAAADRELSGA